MPAVEVSEEARELKQALVNVLEVTDLNSSEFRLIDDTVDYLCDTGRDTNPMLAFIASHHTYPDEDQSKIALCLELAKRLHAKDLHPQRVRALELRLIAEKLGQMAWEQNLAASFDS